MAVQSGTDASQAALITGTKVFRYQDLRFWHEDGLIGFVNEKEGKEKRLVPSEGRLRARAARAEAVRMMQSGGHYRDETKALLRFALEMMDCVKQAETSGCPLDPEKAALEAETARKLIMVMGKVGPTPQLTNPQALYVPGEE